MVGHKKEFAFLLRKLEKVVEFQMCIGGSLPLPALLRSFEIWNARSNTTIQTKMRRVEVVDERWSASDLVGCYCYWLAYRVCCWLLL